VTAMIPKLLGDVDPKAFSMSSFTLMLLAVFGEGLSMPLQADTRSL
jgi:hypothetical protein